MPLFASAQTSWKGTSSTQWSDAGNWTAGVPTATLDAIIGDASFTGANQPAVSSASSCKSLTIGTGAKASTLSISKNLTVSGAVVIGANGTISHTSGNLALTGSWTNSGAYNSSGNRATVVFSGRNQDLVGTTSFRKLTINTGSITTLRANISVARTMTVSGTFDPGDASSSTVSGTGSLTVNSGGVLNVNASTFTGNYGLNGSIILSAGSTVNYSSSTSNQTIANTFTYSTLQVSGSGTKTLAGNLPALNSTAASYGNIAVLGGVLDLAGFTANRGTSVAGGMLTVANGATLKIGGTNTFPANFGAHTMEVSSTVEYGGTDQVVSVENYGNLVLSSSSGFATKTSAAGTLVLNGNFTMNKGSGTGASFTPSGAMSIGGNVTLGAAATFNGSSFSHLIGGNWTNSGTFAGGTSTVTVNAPLAILTGSGTNIFNNLTIARIGVYADSNTVITVSGNLLTTGVGTFSQAPGIGAVVMTGSAKTISGSSISFHNLTVPGSVSSSSSFTVNGNLLVTGTFAPDGTTTFNGTNATIAGGGSIAFGAVSVPGTVTTTNNFSVSRDLAVSGSFRATSGTATFVGTSTLSGTANLFNVTINGTKLQLGTSSTLGIAGTFINTSGAFDVTSSIPNLVNYNGAANQSILSTAYDSLKLSGGATKSASAALVVDSDLTIDTNTTFSAGSFVHSIYRNWNNSGTFSAGTGTIQFVGPLESTIAGNTTFRTLTVNKHSAADTVRLLSNISATTLNMSVGRLLTGSNVVTITSNRTGSGIILGNITRTHSFTPGVAYAFESPFNTITFNVGLLVSSVSVGVDSSPVPDFPFGASINRGYNVNVTSSSIYSATMRLHYEDSELNGSSENSLQFWRNAGSWVARGSSSSSTTDNWVEQAGITDLSGRWTLSDDVNVANWTGAVSTQWENPANWNAAQGAPQLPPGTNDTVQIGVVSFNQQPVIRSSVGIKALTFGSAKAVNLSLVEVGDLTVSGNLGGSWSNSAIHTISVGTNILSVGGDLTLSDGAASRGIQVSVSSGRLSVSGSLQMSSAAALQISGAGQLLIGGDFVYRGGTFAAGNGVVIYNGINSQIVAGVPYNNLQFNKASGVASLTNAATVGGNLILTNNGTFSLAADLTVSSNVSILDGSVLNANSAILTVGGNWTRSAAFSSGTGTVVFSGSTNQTIAATTFNNLTISKTGGTALLNGNSVVNGNLSLSSGTLDLQSFTLTRSAFGGVLTASAGTRLRVGSGTVFPSNFATRTLDATSTVEYYGATAQAISGESYGHLTLLNGGASAKTLVSATTVLGNLLINSGSTLNGSSNSLSLYGSWTNSGTFQGVTGTVILSGTNRFIEGATTFNNLTIPGSYTVLAPTVHISGNLFVSGTFDTATSTMSLDGDLTNTGSLLSNGTTTFTGLRVQTFKLLGAIASSSTGVINFNGSVAPVMQSTTAPLFANVNINNTGGISPSQGWTFAGNVNIGAGASLNGGASTHTFLGSFTNAGTVTSSGTLDFRGTADKTLVLSGSSFVSFGTVRFGGSGRTIILGDAPSFTKVIVANVHTNGISPVTDWLINGDLIVNAGAIFNAGTALTHTIGGNFSVEGTFSGGSSLLVFTGTSEFSGNGRAVLHNVRVNGTITDSMDLEVTGSFTNNGTFDGPESKMTFNGPGGGTIGGTSVPVIDSLEIAKSAATVSLAGSISGLTDLTITSGTFDVGNFSVITNGVTAGPLTIGSGSTLRIGGTATVPNFGSYVFDPASTVEFYGPGTQTIPARNFGNLVSSSTGARVLASSGTIGIAGTFSPGSNVYTNAGSTINYNGAGDQTITAFNYNNLTSSSTGPRVLASNGTIGIASVFTPGSNSYTVTNSTVNFNGAAQTIPAFTYHHITTSGSGTKTLGGNISANGTVTLGAGSFADGGFILTANGDVTSTVTHSGVGKIVLAGSATNNVSGGGLFGNLELNNPKGARLNQTNLTINGLLTLSTGAISTATNRVIINSSASVSRTAGFVSGWLQKPISIGSPIRTFEVGDSSNYAPLTVVFTNVTTAGTLVARTIAAEHPNGDTSLLDLNKSVNRYWSLTNSGTVFSNYTATFQFNTNDLDAGAVVTNLIVRRFDGTNWFATTNSNRTATSVEATRLTAFNDFAVGNLIDQTPSRLAILIQPNATATAGSVFSPQPVIRIETGSGILVSNDNSTVVTVSLSSGTSNLVGTTSAVASNGIVTFTNLSYNKAETVKLLFTSGTLASVSGSNVVINPASASQLVLQSAPSSSATAGQPFLSQPIISIQDAYGNILTGDNTTVVTATRAQGVGALQGTTALVASGGIVAFTNLSHNVATNITIAFSGGSLATVNSGAIAVSPATPLRLTLQVQPSASATAGQVFAQQPVVRIEDAFGNLIASDSSSLITATRSAGAGSLKGTTSVQAVGGIASFANLGHNYATNITIQFTSALLNSVTSSVVTINPSAYNRILLVAPGETHLPDSVFGKVGSILSQTAGAPFTLTYFGVDAYWNRVAVNNSLSVTNDDPYAIYEASFALTNGVAIKNFEARTAKTVSIHASDTVNGTVTAGVVSIPVQSGAYSTLQLLLPGEDGLPGSTVGKTGAPKNQTRGLGFPVKVNAVDQFWNVISNATNLIHLSSDDATAILPADRRLIGGTATLALTNFTLSSQTTLTATDSADSSKFSVSPDYIVATGTPTPASGGLSISADTVNGSYTTLTGPVYREGAQGNAGVGTVILNVPAGFEFATNAPVPTVLIERISGTGPDSENINEVASGTALAVSSVSSTQIVFTVTSVSSGDAICQLTWQNVRVRPKAGFPLATGNVFETGSSALPTLNGSSSNWGTLREVPGAATNLFVVLPGQTFVAGTGPTGTPQNAQGGVPFNIALTAADQFRNVATNYQGSKTISYSGPIGPATYTTSVQFDHGVSTNNVATTLNTLQTTTLLASDGSISGPASANFAVSGAYTKLQILLPGETAVPGTGSGKTGPSFAQTAGTPFSVTVNAVDPNFNIVSTVSNFVALTCNDLTEIMPASVRLTNGSANVLVTLTNASSKTLTSSDVTDNSKTADTSSSLTVNPGAAFGIAITQQPTTAVAGSAISSVIARLKDQFGNNVLQSNVSVTATLGNGAGVLSGSLTHTTDANGVVTFDDLTLTITGSKTLTLSSVGLTSANSVSFAVTPAAAAHLTFTQVPSDAVAGSVFSPVPIVQLRDAYGNAVAQSNVSISLTLSGVGTLNGTTVQQTDADGTAQFPGLSSERSELARLFASSVGLEGHLSAAFFVSPSTAAKLAFSQQPTSRVVGSPIDPAVTVQVQDAYGNDVSTNGLPIRIALSSGSGTLFGNTNAVTVEGIASFDTLSMHQAGSKQFSATAVGMASALSDTFAIFAAEASSIQFVQQPTAALAGDVISPAVTVELADRFGNTVSQAGIVITLSLENSATLLGTVSQGTDEDGLATFNDLSITNAGQHRLVGTAFAPVTSDTFVISPNVATKLVFQQQPTFAVENVVFATAPIVRTQDAYGNNSTNGLSSAVPVTLALTSGSGTLQGTTVRDIGLLAGEGVVMFTNLSINLSGGGKVLTASATNLTSVQTTPFTVESSGGYFQQRTAYSVGQGPTGLWLGNLRGKSTWRDIIVANSASDSITVRLCNDDGSFGNATNYSVGPQPFGVQSGDFNADGFEDVVVANFGTNTVSLLMNSKSRLLAATHLTVGNGSSPGPIAVTLADFNRDGKLDIAVANQTENSVSVMLGTGGGLFAPRVNYPVGTAPSSITAGDMDNDGFFDLITADKSSGTISILRGTAGGTFASAQTIAIGAVLPTYALVGDLNGDGLKDVVVANYGSDSISILMAQGNGSYTETASYTVGNLPRSLLLRDINLDQIFDIAVANSGSGSIDLLLGNGDGTFVKAGVVGAGLTPMIVVGSNFNDDSLTDLAVSCYGSDEVTVIINTSPKAISSQLTLREDALTNFTLRGTSLLTNSFVFAIEQLPTNGTISGIAPNLVYRPNTNFFGSDVLQYRVVAAGITSAVASISFNIQPVNDAPSLSISTGLIDVPEDSLVTTVSAFVTATNAGPTNEASQSVSFQLTSSPAGFFSIAPSVTANGTLTFRPAANKIGDAIILIRAVDSGGTANGGVNTSPYQSFIIHVTANPVKALRGVYSGLFHEADAVQNQSSGWFSFSLVKGGMIRGRLRTEGYTYAISNMFDTAGGCQLAIARTNKPTLYVAMQLDLTNGTDRVFGTVSNGTWTATLLGDRCIFNARTNIAPQTGRYTMVLPGSGTSIASPAGNGYATIRVDAAGGVRMTGATADGQTISQGTRLSKSGQWPLFVPLYKGKGSLLSWINFTNAITNSLEGDMIWIKTQSLTNSYAVGFTNELQVYGSRYFVPTNGTRAINLTNAELQLFYGNLLTPITNLVQFTSDNRLLALSSPQGTLFTVNTNSGYVSGTFTHPRTKLKTTLRAVLLPQSQEIRGYFMGTNASGAAEIR